MLTWKEGADVIRTTDVPRTSHVRTDEHGNKGIRFPELSSKVEKEWQQMGVHRDATDRKRDQVVVHAPNELPYSEVVAVMDAVSAPQRSPKHGAFELTFAAD